jgi:hypothetical protein
MFCDMRQNWEMAKTRSEADLFSFVYPGFYSEFLLENHCKYYSINILARLWHHFIS